MDKIEALARALAADDRIDPDVLCVDRKHIFWVNDRVQRMPDSSYVRPAWSFYVPLARRALAVVERTDAS